MTPERRVDRERDAIDQTVRHPDRMDRECAELEALVGAHLTQVGIVEQSVFVELVFDIGERELSAPDGNVEFGENPGQRADVVLVTVREDDPAHTLAVFDKI